MRSSKGDLSAKLRIPLLLEAQAWRPLIRTGLPLLRSVRARACFQPALALLVLLVLAAPAMESPPAAMLRAQRAVEVVRELSLALSLEEDVQLAVVANHPLVFSVERANSGGDRFVLSMELGFLLMLEDAELRAAVAHELGHVWIFTHHPFLHTERLANEIGQRIVSRANFEKVYTKLWAYEGASGVPMDELLGPDP